MKINKMDRVATKKIDDWITSKLEESKDEINVDFTTTSASYDPQHGEITFRIKATLQGVEPKELQVARDIASIDEIPESAFSEPKDALINGKKMKIIISGYRRKARRNPWTIKDVLSGDEYNVDQNYVQQKFRSVAK